MILHYIYVPKYAIFQDAELHFTDHYTISFDYITRHLLCEPNPKSLPKDFFSYSPNGKSRVMDSVSALIGNNGSGKTSVAYLISDILRHEETEHLIIWSSEEEGRQRLFCHYMLIPHHIPDQNALSLLQSNLITEKRNKAKIVQACYTREQNGSFRLNRSSQYYELLCKQFSRLNPMPPITIDNDSVTDLSNVQFHPFQHSFIYCTNNYAVSHGISNYKNVIDLSTGYLMREDASKYLNDRPGSRPNYSQANYHDRMELSRMVNLFSHLKNETGAFPSYWSFPKPVGVLITLNLADAKQIQHHLSDLNTSASWAKLIQRLLDILSEWSANQSQHSFADLQLFAFVGNWLRYHAKSFQTQPELSQRLCDAVEAACHELPSASGTNCPNVPRVLFHHLYDATRKQSFYDSKNEEVLYGPDDSLSAALELHKLLKSEASQSKGTSFYLRLSDHSKLDLFANLSKCYFESFTITPYIDFQWHPRLSAGELAQYTIFSRLFHIISSKSKSLRSDILVFFDEIEITIHPALQRRLVENVVVFLESVFTGHKIHVIFASHSPILLSDIPSSNVCYLKKDGATTRVLNPVADKLPESFGANIHTLYRHSFFLDGLIGSFAQHVIEELDKTIQSISDSSDENAITNLEKRISLIGEPFLRQQLLHSLATRCPKSLARLKLKAELDAINTRQKELIDALERNND